jgi:hypothetical protein
MIPHKRRRRVAQRPDRNGRVRRIRHAIFVVGIALEQGFRLRTRCGRLVVIAPPGTAPERGAFIRNTLDDHRAEVITFLRWLESERAFGCVWTPPATMGAVQ